MQDCEIQFTDEWNEWYGGLSSNQQDAVVARLDLLAEEGPQLRRPVVGQIVGSKHDPRMKELVVKCEGHLRVLFMFDPRGVAILLLGGDKAGAWNAWYDRAIPQADALYDTYLAELREEGLLP